MIEKGKLRWYRFEHTVLEINLHRAQCVCDEEETSSSAQATAL